MRTLPSSAPLHLAVSVPLLLMLSWACGSSSGESSDTGAGGTVAPGTGDAGSGTTPPDGSDGGPVDIDPEAGVRARGVSVSAIELNQGVGIGLVEGGAVVPTSARKAPVIGGRPGLLRVSVGTSPEHEVRELEGRLTINYADGTRSVFVNRALIVRDSNPADLGTQFHWHLDDKAVLADATFSVGVFETSDAPPEGPDAGSRYPADGSAPFDAWGDRMELEVVLVPVETACGTKLVVSDAALEANRKALFDAFPLQKLTMRYRETWRKMTTCPGGVGEIAAEANAAANEDGAPPHVLYAALTGPDGFKVEGNQALGQAFSTVGSDAYSGNAAGGDGVSPILVHETGHSLGRPHPWEEDSSYPYDDMGKYEGWGYRISRQMLVPSDGLHDIMSYTYPTWISEYTYAKCAEFLKAHPPAN